MTFSESTSGKLLDFEYKSHQPLSMEGDSDRSSSSPDWSMAVGSVL
jgi:hypothetical protein